MALDPDGHGRRRRRRARLGCTTSYADTLAAVGVEHYQQLADSPGPSVRYWARSVKPGATRTTAFTAKRMKEPAMKARARSKYQIEAVGVTATYWQRFTAQLEDRQIDVQPTHGNLPKLGLAYQWNPRISSPPASFSSSVSGNLGTHLGGLRLDYYHPGLNYLVGVAYGQASPTVLNIDIGLVIPGQRLKEGYAGIVKPLSTRARRTHRGRRLSRTLSAAGAPRSP